MNSEHSKTSDPYRLLFNLFDKINLKRSDKCIALSNLSIYCNGSKMLSKNNKLKYQLQCGMINLHYLTNDILYQTFRIILSIF